MIITYLDWPSSELPSSELSWAGEALLAVSSPPVLNAHQAALSCASILTLTLGLAQPSYAQTDLLDFDIAPAKPVAGSVQPPPAAAPRVVASPQVAIVPSIAPPSGILEFEPGLAPLPVGKQGSPPAAVMSSSPSLDVLFAGGTDSLVAIAIGAAEGTRMPNGGKTPAYYGHVDPGNGVWNMGTFSYQHGAASPEDADRRQLRRLQRQAEQIQRIAAARGMTLTLEEKLNGIDLANQAPAAALEPPTYIDWLARAHQRGLEGSEAVIWARVRSFLDPATGTWNAPGLGNRLDSITHDQERRFQAIARAIIVQEPAIANRGGASSAVVADLPQRKPTPEVPVRSAVIQKPPEPEVNLTPQPSSVVSESGLFPNLQPPEVATAAVDQSSLKLGVFPHQPGSGLSYEPAIEAYYSAPRAFAEAAEPSRPRSLEQVAEALIYTDR